MRFAVNQVIETGCMHGQIYALSTRHQEHVTGVPTGFYDLDDITAGLQPSDLVVIAGRKELSICDESIPLTSGFTAELMRSFAF